jgi:hypothetical protein
MIARSVKTLKVQKGAGFSSTTGNTAEGERHLNGDRKNSEASRIMDTFFHCAKRPVKFRPVPQRFHEMGSACFDACGVSSG